MKSRRWKTLGIVLAILALGMIAVAIVLPRLLDLNAYRGIIASQIEDATGGTVSLGRLSWGISNGLWVEADGLSIANASAFPGDLRLSRLSASLALRPLLSKQIVLNRLLLDRPDVRLRFAHGPKDTTRQVESPPTGAKPAGTAIPIAIERLVIRNGRLRLEDALSIPGRKLVRTFTDVAITVAPLALGRELDFEIALQDEAPAGLGVLKARGTFSGLTESLTLEQPKLAVKASLASLHTDAIKPYLGSSSAVQRLAGSVSLTIQYDGDLSRRHRAEGTLDLGRMAYADPTLWDAPLPGTATTVAYRMRLDPTQLTVEHLAVKRGTLALTGSGAVHAWSERPVLRDVVLSADTQLRELIPLMPWKLLGAQGPTLRAILEDGGQLVVDHAKFSEWKLGAVPPTAEDLLSAVDLAARVSGVSVPSWPNAPKFRRVGGVLRLARGVADVEGVRGQFASVQLPTISTRITGLPAQPRMEGTVKGPLKVETGADADVAALLRQVGLEQVGGTANMNLAFALEAARPKDVRLQGRVGLRGVTAKTAFSPARLESLTADVAIAPDAAEISNLSTTLVVPTAASASGGRVTVALQGRIDAWSRQPALTLHHLRTSPISLPVAASLVPWDSMGESAGALRAILLAGGSVMIEELILPRIDLSKPPKDLTLLLPQAKAVAALTDLAFQLHPEYPKFERMTGRASLDGGVVTATGVRGQIGFLVLPDISFQVTRLDTHPRVTVQSKGPVQLAETRDPKIAELLKGLGVKSLTGPADIDVHVEFDRAQPQAWVTSASLVLTGVRAHTYPAGIVVEDLRGRVSVDRGNAINIAADEVSGKIDGAPVRFSGTLRGVGTPDLTLDATVYAKGLDLAHAREFFPPLTTLNLAGRLDMDVGMSLPAAAANARLNGTLVATNVSVRLPAYGVTVSGGDVEVALRGDTADILRMRVRVNDQVLAVTGQVKNPVEPDIRLVVTSPDLDLNRLLAPTTGGTPTSTPSSPDTGRHDAKPAKAELPAIALKTTAQLQVQAKQGQYRVLKFHDLKLDAAYDRGVLTRWGVDFGVQDGRIAATGSADLRDLSQVPFVVRPQVTSVKLGTVAPLLGFDRLPVSGPLSLTGNLQGRTGSTKDLLTSLAGDVRAEMGPGTLTRIGKFGATMAKILSFTSVKGLLSGRFLDDFSGKGLPYRTMTAQATFAGGGMDVGAFAFHSDTLTMDARGRIDLLNERQDMHAQMEVLGIVSEVLELVPIIGRSLGALTAIHLRVTGSLDDPDVRMAVAQGAKDAVTDEEQSLRRPLRGTTDTLEKGVDTLLGK
jgi:uncharacterized protein involved in outer membrane biogenesis